MSRTAETTEASSVRVSSRSKAALVEAARAIGAAGGKVPHLSDLVDDLVARFLPRIVEYRVHGPGDQGGA